MNKLILDILELMVKMKKKNLGLLKDSFLRSLVGVAKTFFISLKGAL